MSLMAGKTCVVTGAAGSIGLASTEKLLAEGANVLLVDLNEDRLKRVGDQLREYDGRFEIFPADVSKADAVANFMSLAAERWGGIDVIFSNAGLSGDICNVTDYPEEVFDRVMAVNVKASFLACKHGIPLMNDGGSIIITSSIMGVRADAGIVAYTTSKHAVIGMARTVAKEVAPRRIRVNVLAPGPVENDFQSDIEDRLGSAIGVDATEMINGMIPLHRHASAEEIANMVLFLASDQSSFSTAGVFMADGGMNA